MVEHIFIIQEDLHLTIYPADFLYKISLKIPFVSCLNHGFSLILVMHSVREKVGENVEQKRIKEGIPDPRYTWGCLFTRPHALSLWGDLITGNQGSPPLLGTYPSLRRAHVLYSINGSPFLASNGGHSETDIRQLK